MKHDFENEYKKAGNHGLSLDNVRSRFSYYLHHYPKNVENNGSRLSLRLASALKEFGLVGHSVWVEMP